MKRLADAVQYYRTLTFAESTKKSYRSHMNSYLKFCHDIGSYQFPVDEKTVALYVAYLADRLSYSSITKYINVLRLLHLEAGFPSPLGSWYISSVLKGVRRDKGDRVMQKLPITPHILLGIKSCLNLSAPADVVFWAACLVGFFALLRKANLVPPSESSFRSDHHLVRQDLTISQKGIALHIKWSKTIQFQSRSLFCPLPLLQSHPLCPVSAVARLLLLAPSLPGSAPLFAYPTPHGLALLSQSKFTARLRQCLSQIGLPVDKFSGHSLRRGGASWLWEAGMPSDYIQMIGDWKSDAYKLYLSSTLSSKFDLLHQYTTNLPYS